MAVFLYSPTVLASSRFTAIQPFSTVGYGKMWAMC